MATAPPVTAAGLDTPLEHERRDAERHRARHPQQLRLATYVARVFVTRELPGPAIGRLEAKHDVEVWTDRLPPPYETLKAKTADVEGLLPLLTDRIDEPLIANARNLKAISNYAVGFDNIDLDAASRQAFRSATRRTSSPTPPRTWRSPCCRRRRAR